MEIIISSNTSKPIYEQITSQIKAMIMSGELKTGEPIPSMRALAKSIHVSVITVQKAYEDLQRDGFIETTVGEEVCIGTEQRLLSGRTAEIGRRTFARGRRHWADKWNIVGKAD